MSPRRESADFDVIHDRKPLPWSQAHPGASATRYPSPWGSHTTHVRALLPQRDLRAEEFLLSGLLGPPTRSPPKSFIVECTGGLPSGDFMSYPIASAFLCAVPFHIPKSSTSKA